MARRPRDIWTHVLRSGFALLVCKPWTRHWFIISMVARLLFPCIQIVVTGAKPLFLWNGLHLSWCMGHDLHLCMMHNMDGSKQYTSVVGRNSPIQDIGTYVGTYIARSRVIRFHGKNRDAIESGLKGRTKTLTRFDQGQRICCILDEFM